DWEKYSRIVGVTWSGSVSPSFVFTRAELYANEAGRELAKVLKSLIEAQIQINIITHSLGARVALAALNILGDFDGKKYDEKVDNLIMWEAAVADNAMTGNYTREKNALAMELFPFAHKAVKRMRILYSQEDGVLGYGGVTEDGYGIVGGAYNKKYYAMGGLADYYQQNLLKAQYEKIAFLRQQCLRPAHLSALSATSARDCVDFSASSAGRKLREEVRKLLEAEAQSITGDLNDNKEALNYLRPWSHYRRFEVGSEYFEHIIDVLTNLVLNNWSIDYKDMAVRPALGHQGERLTVGGDDEPLSEAEQKEWRDPFIEERYEKQFWFWDQSNYFITHSAMREFEFKIFDKNGFFADIYKESYKTQIMDRWIKENSKFGRY
ncbi:alpha/beta hydrolase, partial [Bisgaard Taxon 10/6]|uniref:alpha/beta hydrolase n=1 Tax=Exercitatus varius TaxID=67857 RepID=UPI00294AD913